MFYFRYLFFFKFFFINFQQTKRTRILVKLLQILLSILVNNFGYCKIQ